MKKPSAVKQKKSSLVFKPLVSAAKKSITKGTSTTESKQNSKQKTRDTLKKDPVISTPTPSWIKSDNRKLKIEDKQSLRSDDLKQSLRSDDLSTLKIEARKSNNKKVSPSTLNHQKTTLHPLLSTVKKSDTPILRDSDTLMHIGDAAKFLKVSIDTLRRWEKMGKISPTRTPGGTRLYSKEVLEQAKTPDVKSGNNKTSGVESLFSISEAAKRLGVSTKTLRRWDEAGKLIASRNKEGERVYKETEIEEFTGKSQETEARRHLNVRQGDALPSSTSQIEPEIITIATYELSQSLPQYIKRVSVFAAAALVITLLLTSSLVAGYFTKPQMMGRLFAAQGQVSGIKYQGPQTEKISKELASNQSAVDTIRAQQQILGESTSSSRNTYYSLLNTFLSPFNNLAQNIIEAVAPAKARDLGFYQKNTDARFDLDERAIIEVDDKTIAAKEELSEKLSQTASTINHELITMNSQINSTTVNLLRNSSFEKNASGQPDSWFYVNESASNNTIVNNASVRTGNHALLLEPKNGKENFGIYQPYFVTKFERPYTLSLYLDNQSAQTFTLKLGFWDKNNNRRIAAKDIEVASSPGWKRYSYTLDPPDESVTGLDFYPMIEALGLSAKNVFIDDIQLEEGEAASTYEQENMTAGDGSIAIDANGNITPTTSRTGSLGTDSFRFGSLYLTKAHIDNDGNANFGGSLTVASSATIAADLTVNGDDIQSSSSTFRLFPENVLNLTIGGSATAIGIGSANGTTTINNNLAVTGTSTFTGSTTFTGGIALPDGSSSTPALRFTNDTDSGLYRLTANTLRLTTAGSANNGVTINSVGNVGIGNTSPLELLEAGTTNTASDNYLRVSAAGGNAYRAGIKMRVYNEINGATIEYDNRLPVGLNFLLHDNDAAGQSAMFIAYNTRYVGIGTTAPGNLLTVNGNVGIGTTAFVNAGLSVMTGNVGIGTTSPSQKLDVAGSANLSTGNTYKIAGTDVLSSTVLGSGVVTSSLTTVGALASGSIASGFGTISTGNTITTTGTMGTAATTTFTGAGGTFSANVNANGGLDIDDAFVVADGGALTTSQAATFNGNVFFGTSTGILNATTGNVGIGTTSPGALFDISGNTASMRFTETGTGARTWEVGSGVVSNGFLSFYDVTYPNESVLTLDTSRRIGVRDTAPNAVFEISGDGDVTNDLFMVSSSNTKNGDRFIVKNGGNVGIGTTAPSALLEVNGALKATTFNGNTITTGTGTLTMSAGKTLTVSDSTTLGTNAITFGGAEVLTLAAAKNVTFADAFVTSGAYSLTLTTTGTTNVTLPTTGTLSTLAGTETLSGKTFTGNTFFPGPGIWDTNGNVGIGTTTPGANTRLSVMGGNVGIGTTSPGGTLELAQGLTGASSGTNYILKIDPTLSGAVNTTAMTSLYGTYSVPAINLSGTSGTLTNWYGNYVGGSVGTGTTSTVTNWNGIYVASPTTSATGTITNKYALVTEASAGNIGIGTTTSTLSRMTVAGGSATTGLAFLVQDSAYANRFAIQGNGNVGIGTTVPLDKLEVTGTTGSGLVIGIPTSTVTDGYVVGQIAFRSRDDSGVASNDLLPSIKALMRTSATDPANIGAWANEGNDLAFFTSKRPSNDAAVTISEIMRLTKDGNVGIGSDDTPDYQLELYDGTNTPTFGMSDDDVAHSFTDLVNADTFAHLTSLSTTAGGGLLQSFSDGDASGFNLKVGIGITNPTDSTPAIKLIGGKLSGTTLGDLAAAETVFQIANNDDAPALSVMGSGNIGIGTTTSTLSRLTIAGGSATTGLAFLVQDSAYTNRFAIQGDGNVGIGTTAPTALLEVNGALKATTFNGNTITTGTGTLTMSAGKTLTVSDSTTLGTNAITFGGAEVLTLAAAKNVTFADAFVTSGAYSLTLTTTGTTNVTLPTTGTMATLAGTETLSGKTFSGNTFFPGPGIWDTNGNVGIGTTTPGANTRLSVMGGNVGIGTTAPAEKLQIVGGRLRLPQTNEPTTPTLNFGDGDSGLYEVADDQIWMAISGTNSVKFTFESTLFGSGDDGNANIMIEVPTATNPVYSFYNDADTGIGWAGANILSLIAGGTNGLNVNSSGNVGIGTTSPGGTLELAQGLTGASSGTNYILKIDPTLSGAVNTTAMTSLYGTYSVPAINLSGTSGTLTNWYGNYVGGSVGTGTTTTVTNWNGIYVASPTTSATGTITNKYALVTEASAGNIGIGTTTSTLSRLTIAGGSTTTGLAFLVQDSAYANRFAIQGNGNVGLGTTSPQQLLTLSADDNPILRFDRSGAGKSDWEIFSLSGGDLRIRGGADNVGSNLTESLAIDGTGGVIIGSALTGTEDSITNGILVVSTNIGVGDTTPDYTLELYDATNTPTLGMSDDDVSHSFTDLVNADTFAHLTSLSTTSGGALLQSFSDGDASGFNLKVGIGTTNPTDSTPAIKLIGGKLSGTTLGDLAAAETVFQIANNDDAPALSILGNGNVGIGTTSPLAKLDVAGTSLTGGTFTGTSKGILGIRGDDYNDGDVLGIDFTSPTHTGPYARIATKITNSGSYLQFGTSNVYDSGVTNTAMIIDYVGNVGVGDSTPAALFTVGDGDLFRVNSSGYALLPDGAASTPSLSFTGDTNTGIYRLGADILRLTTAGSATAGITIAADGNVGIGTTSPLSMLQLRTAASSDPSFSLADGDVAHGVTTIAPTDDFLRIVPISSTVGGAYINGLADATGVALQLRGIQNSDPTDSTPAIFLVGAKASGTGVVDLGAAETVFQVANNDDAAALTILGNGNVGIGTTGPSSILQLGSGNLTWATDGGGNIGASGANRPGSIYAVSSLVLGTGGVVITDYIKGAADADIVTLGHGNSNFQLKTQNNRNFIIVPHGTGNTIINNGNVGIGTTVPGGTLELAQGLTGASSGTNYILKIDPTLSGAVNTTAMTSLYGTYSVPAINLSGTSGTLTNWYGNYVGGSVGTGTTTTVTNWNGIYVASPTTSATGTITNKYALVTEASAGNIGIGTTTSTLSRMTVAGGSATTGLAFLVQDSAYANRFAIQGDGNVGIGTTTPNVKFEISDSGQGVDQRITSTHANGYPALRFYRNSSTELGGVQGGVNDAFDSNGDNVFLYNTINDGKIIFRTKTSNTAQNSLTILGNGNIGIGTTSPLALTHIYQTGSADALRVDDSASDTSYFVIDQYGNVGIGTTSPTYKLDVTGDGRLTTGLTVGTTAANSTARASLTINGDETIKGKVDLVTSGLSGVTDVYVYDTTKDSDGGKWRNDERAKASSWYNETIDNTGAACTNDTDDRCGRKEFPEKAIIVATSTDLYIFDAKDNTQWMNFDTNGAWQASSNAIGISGTSIDSVYALNGVLYATLSTGNEALARLDFKKDESLFYRSGDGPHKYNAGLGSRNAGSGHTNLGYGASWYILDITNGPNDVFARTINGKTYVAVATDAGFSVINETDQVIYDYADNALDDYNQVWLDGSGNLWATNETTGTLEKWNNVINDSADENPGTPDSTWDETTTPALAASAPTIQVAPGALYGTDGTSTVDGKSPTVYIGTDKGLTVLQTKAGSETAGSVKYYTKTHITEEMVGDTRGMWSFSVDGSDAALGSTVAAASTLGDASLKNSDLTVFGNTMNVVTGVRGKALQFDGSTNYLKSTATTFSPGTGSMSAGAWINASSALPDGVILHSGNNDTSNTYWRLFIGWGGDNQNKVAFGIHDGTTGSGSGSSPMAVNDDKWHFVVGVRDTVTDKVYIYVDGVQVNSGTDNSGNVDTSTLGLWVGVRGDGGTLGLKLNGSLDEPFVTMSALTPGEIKHMYEVGKRALDEHTASRITGVTGADNYQRLMGNASGGTTTSNTVKAVAVDSSNQFIYAGVSDATTNTGGVTVLGVDSDSAVDLYDGTANTGKDDDAGTQFSANDVVAISLSGTPIHAYNSGTSTSNNGAVIAIAGTNDTATRAWMQSNDYSLYSTLAQLTSPDMVKDSITATNIFKVFNTYNNITNATTGERIETPALSVDSGGNLVYNYLGTSTSATALDFNDSVLTTGSMMDLTSTTLTTGTVLGLTANALTSGTGLNISSSATAMTGTLEKITLSGSNAANTGSLLELLNSGTANANTSLYIKHYATGTGNYALRVDDVSGDTSPFVIQGDGNVGIGTTSPGDLIHVRNGSGVANLRLEGNSGNPGLMFYVGSTLKAQIYEESGDDTLRLGTGTGAQTDLVIASNGNIGIGITSPLYSLDVSKSAAGGPVIAAIRNTDNTADSNSRLVIQSGGSSAGDAYVHLAVAGTSTEWAFGIDNSDSDKFKLATNGDLNVANVLTADLGGNIGINTTTPGNRFTVNGNVGIGTTAAINAQLAVMSGNVGIGTTSPGALLHVNGTMRATQIGTSANPVSYQYNDRLWLSTVGSGIEWTDIVSANIHILNSALFFGVDTGAGRSFVFGASPYRSNNYDHGTQTNPTLFIQDVTDPNVTNNKWGSLSHDGTGLVITSGANTGAGTTPATIDNYIAFAPRGTEQVRINGSGNVGIGTTAPAHKIDVVGTAGLSTGTAWTNTSDARFKNIQSELNGSSLDKVIALRPVSYTWNELHDTKYGADPGTNFGFIAQEVAEIIPEFIGETSDGYLTYNPSGIEAILTAAIQEQQGQINSIKGDVLSILGTEATQSAAIAALQNKTANLSVAESGVISSGVGFDSPEVSTGQLLVSGNVGIGTTDPGAYKLAVNGPGFLNDTGWTYASDRRLKDNITEIGAGIAVINALNPVTFDYINGGQNRSGFIAQEVQQILPSIVSQRADGMLALRTEEIVPYTVKAIQELNDQVAKLQDSLQMEADGTLNVSAIKAGKLLLANISLEETGLTSNGSSLTTVDPEGYSQPVSQTQFEETVASIKYQVSRVDELTDKMKALEDRITQLEASQSAQVAGIQTSTPSAEIAALPNVTPTPTPTATTSAQLVITLSEQEASRSATSSASLILNTDPLPLDMELTSPDVLLATSSAILTNLQVQSDATFSGKLQAYEAIISDTFKSFGQTFLGNTTVAGDFSIDGTMSITGNSINSIGASPDGGPQGLLGGGTLYIQNSPLATAIDFFNGQVTIDKTGKLTAQEIVTNVVTAGQVNIIEQGSSSTIGTSTLPANQTRVAVFTDKVTQGSKIFITPRASTSGQALFVEAMEPGVGFVVSIDQALTHDLDFDWWIIEVK